MVARRAAVPIDVFRCAEYRASWCGASGGSRSSRRWRPCDRHDLPLPDRRSVSGRARRWQWAASEGRCSLRCLAIFAHSSHKTPAPDRTKRLGALGLVLKRGHGQGEADRPHLMPTASPARGTPRTRVSR